MTVTVRFFAWYAEKLGRSKLSLELAEGSTVADVLDAVASLPGGSVVPAGPLVAVNQSYAMAGTKLHHDDEVALIPPVAGG